MKRTPKPKRAKLIADGGFYQFVPLKELVVKMHVPVMRRIRLNEPSIDLDVTWRFDLVFSLSRVTKSYAEYRQVDSIRVEERK